MNQPLVFTPGEIAAYCRARLPKIRQRGTEWRGPCPVHKGERDSFAVNSKTGLIHCHRCKRGWNLVTLEMDLTGADFKEAKTQVCRIAGRIEAGSGKRIIATYKYAGPDGKLLYEVVRYDPKDFRQRRPDGNGGHVWNLKGVKRVLYRLPEIAAKPTKSVFIAEGEKDVAALEGLGLLATCNAGGAGKWQDSYSAALKGRNVLILPDNDAPGRKHALAVARSLLDTAARIRIVTLPEGKDAADWVAAGGNVAKLRALATAAEDFKGAQPTPPPQAPEPQPTAPPPPTHEKEAEQPTLSYIGNTYESYDRGLCWWQPRSTGRTAVWLTNFTARILSDVVMDDGAESSRMFRLEVKMNGRAQTLTLPAKEFVLMNWPTEQIGAGAIVYPNLTQHAKLAVQIHSGRVPERRVYRHTGWRQIEDVWFYLHGEGAVGPAGRKAEVETELTGGLKHYALPEPPEGAALRVAIRASLQMLDVAPHRVTVPLYAAVWRAVLGTAEMSLHLSGQTGAGKSQLAALAQQHYGARMDSRHLPAAWSSTANALESLAFEAKDALLTVDDFVPQGNSADVQRLHRDADRLLRAQGNNAGRQRMRADTTLRPERPPRGLILSTGEDVPRGNSLRARLVVVEMAPTDIDWNKLTQCQANGAAGLYAQALAAFIRWIAPRMENMPAIIQKQIAASREREAMGMHKRTPDNLNNLGIGYKMLLAFAQEVGAISKATHNALWDQAVDALSDAARAQDKQQHAAEPCAQFIDGLQAVLSSGRGHVAMTSGDMPREAGSWGWRRDHGDWKPGGDRIGWVDGEEVYIQPQAAFAAVQQLGRDTGEHIVVSLTTLNRRLKQRGLLASVDMARETATVRRVCEGVKQAVLHFSRPSLYPCTASDIPDTEEKVSGFDVGKSGRFEDPTRNPTLAKQ